MCFYTFKIKGIDLSYWPNIQKQNEMFMKQAPQNKFGPKHLGLNLNRSYKTSIKQVAAENLIVPAHDRILEEILLCGFAIPRL